MFTNIKKGLAHFGLIHPSLGIKVTAEKKAEILLAARGDRQIFIETGTHKGDMLERMKMYFKELHSVELDTVLFENARRRFENDQHIHIYQGDSALILRKIVTNITQPALFWLDAHAPGVISHVNSPIVSELEAIVSHPVRNHKIVIDDARHFSRSTINFIKKMTQEHGFTFSIEHGTFLIAPQ